MTLVYKSKLKLKKFKAALCIDSAEKHKLLNYHMFMMI